MKKIDTSAIAGAAGLPIIKATHDQWNENTAQVTASIVTGLLGSYITNDLIVLYGCVVAVTSGSIPGTGTATLTAGAIFYNGEIYQVDANLSLSTTNPQTLVWQVVTTYRSGDPILWSDGVTRNQHREDKLRLVAGTSGTGIADYGASSVKNLLDIINGVWLNTTSTTGANLIAPSGSIVSLNINYKDVGGDVIVNFLIKLYLSGTGQLSFRVPLLIPGVTNRNEFGSCVISGSGYDIPVIIRRDNTVTNTGFILQTFTSLASGSASIYGEFRYKKG